MTDPRAPLDQPQIPSELVEDYIALEASPCDRCDEGPHGRMVLQPFAWLCRPCWRELRNSGSGFLARESDERERLWLASAPPDVLADLVERWVRGEAA